MDAISHLLSVLDPAGSDYAVQLNAFALEIGLTEMQATAALAVAPEKLDRTSFVACAIGLAKAATGRLQQQAIEARARSEAVAAIAALWETPMGQTSATRPDECVPAPSLWSDQIPGEMKTRAEARVTN